MRIGCRRAISPRSSFIRRRASRSMWRRSREGRGSAAGGIAVAGPQDLVASGADLDDARTSSPKAIELLVFSSEGGPTLVGAIELVSPANKDRPEARRAFAAKCASYLHQGIGLVIIDVVTSRAANLHNELVALLNQPTSSSSSANAELYAVAYRPVRRSDSDEIEIWPHGAGTRQGIAGAAAVAGARSGRACRISNRPIATPASGGDCLSKCLTGHLAMKLGVDIMRRCCFFALRSVRWPSWFRALWRRAAKTTPQRAKDALIVRTLLRLPGVDLSDEARGEGGASAAFGDDAGEASSIWRSSRSSRCARRRTNCCGWRSSSRGTLGVKAAGLLVKFDERELLAKAIADPDPAKGGQDGRACWACWRMRKRMTRSRRWLSMPSSRWRFAPPRWPRWAAMRRGRSGCWRLVEQGKLPADLKFAAANVLLSSADEAIRTAAGKHLSLPATAGGEPLPPIAELVKRSGDAARGKELFATTGTCAKCHKVNGEGKEVGPDLSEIGSKLSQGGDVRVDPRSQRRRELQLRNVARSARSTARCSRGVLVSQTDDGDRAENGRGDRPQAARATTSSAEEADASR